MQHIKLWLHYRSQGLANAWTLAEMWKPTVKLLRSLTLMCSIVGLILVISQRAEAIQVEADQKLAVDRQNLSAYVKALENVVAACVSDSTGKPIKVGDKTYLCGIVEVM